MQGAGWGTACDVSEEPGDSGSRVTSSEEAQLTYRKYDEMVELLRGCRHKVYQQWVGTVDQDCHFNLRQPLIQRDPDTGLIQVNFSKAVSAGPVGRGHRAPEPGRWAGDTKHQSRAGGPGLHGHQSRAGGPGLRRGRLSSLGCTLLCPRMLLPVRSWAAREREGS